MSVPNYKTIKKINIDDFIKHTIECSAIINSAPLEHYDQEELKDLTEKARKLNYIVTLKCERSNLYQGTLLQLIKEEDIQEYYKYI